MTESARVDEPYIPHLFSVFAEKGERVSRARGAGSAR